MLIAGRGLETRPPEGAPWGWWQPPGLGPSQACVPPGPWFTERYGHRAPGDSCVQRTCRMVASPSSCWLVQFPERPGLMGVPGQGQARVQGGVGHCRPLRVPPLLPPQSTCTPERGAEHRRGAHCLVRSSARYTAAPRRKAGSSGARQEPQGRRLLRLLAWVPGEIQEGRLFPSVLLLDTPCGQLVKAVKSPHVPFPQRLALTPELGGGGKGGKASQGAEPGTQGAGGQGRTCRACRGCEHPRTQTGKPPEAAQAMVSFAHRRGWWRCR